MYSIIKYFLFKQDPEKVHYQVMSLLNRGYRIPFVRKVLQNMFHYEHPSLERELWGIKFKNPVGLAAGFDKNGSYIDALSTLGFGFIEIGTLTPLAQPGNPQPRLFRLPKDRALINRMGFNNEGVETAAKRVALRKQRNIVIGGNIGKNKITPNDSALDDYVKAFKALFNEVDYIAVNVSSPNTPNLRELQEKSALKLILSALIEERTKLLFSSSKRLPILLKIAPDLTQGQLDDVIDLIQELALDGIIATNTTIDHSGLQTSKTIMEEIGAGGLSGVPVREKSTQIVKYIHQRTNGKIPIIAVGGIEDANDAIEKLQAGASLVQVYTGFVYKGPAIVKKICKGLVEKSNYRI